MINECAGLSNLKLDHSLSRCPGNVLKKDAQVVPLVERLTTTLGPDKYLHLHTPFVT
jgi:hypothetical protein